MNGHEWVERQAWRKKVVTVKDGNCFVEGSDFPGIGRLAAELNRPGAIGRLRKLCERWIYSTCLCFALPSETRKRSGFAYQYSVFQLELSRTCCFCAARPWTRCTKNSSTALENRWILSR